MITPIIVGRAAGARSPLAHIPGEDGWPVVGNTLKMLRDPVGRAEAMHRKYGPVHRDHLLGFPNVSLLGPEANEFVLLDREKNFSSAAGWAPILGRIFPRALMLMDFEEHRRHRKALVAAFKPGAMAAYLDAINAGVAARLAEWHAQGRDGAGDIRFFPAIKQLTLDLAATSFLGIALGPDAAAINRAFIDMIAATVAVVRAPIPFTPMSKGVRGRAVIVAFLRREIAKRREGDAGDLFSELCRTGNDDGSLLSDQEIIDHFTFLMGAAHDTLTSSITSLVQMLAMHPDWQERLRAEVVGLGLPASAGLSAARLAELEQVEMAFKEALRIHSPFPSILRRALRPFEFDGHAVPGGTLVIVNPAFSHRMPAIWPEPERFDPLRFTRAAIDARHKYAWVPFSGGAHACLGQHFAMMQAKCFFYHLLRTTRISLAPGYAPRWQMWPIPKPRDGLLIRFERAA
jgi:cytochrome P450